MTPLTSERFDEAAALLAEAFHTNPPHVYAFPDEARRERQMAWLMRRNVRAQASVGEGFCLVEEGSLAAMGFWERPTARGMGVAAMVRHGLLFAPFFVGFGCMRRALEVNARIDGVRAQALGRRPAWCLHNYAIAEAKRGRGLGGQVLEAELVRVQRTEAAPVVLDTQRPRNVDFYRKLGFRVLDERVLSLGPSRLRNWVLLFE